MARFNRTFASAAGALLAACVTTPAAVPEKQLRKEVVVDATPAQVYETWTTAEGLKTFFAPNVRIEPRVGGPFEILFDVSKPEGSRGSEGCTFLELDPPKHLAFTWNFPPKLPTIRNEHTRVSIDLEPVGAGQTHVVFTQTGWKTGGEWDEGFAYFDRAWGMVLSGLETRFKSGPIDWSKE